MRGKDVAFGSPHTPCRITPAYAGKSLPHPHSQHSKRDHPRLCGEKHAAAVRDQGQAGSPPPMRGKAKKGIMKRTYLRITPAYAGKRQGAGNQQQQKWDHPAYAGKSLILMKSIAG